MRPHPAVRSLRRWALALVLAVAPVATLHAQPADLARRAQAEFDIGHGPAAIELWQQALAGYRAAGDGVGELRTLFQLGTTSSLLGRYADANAHFADALKIARAAKLTAVEDELLLKLADSASRSKNASLATTANRDLLARAEANGNRATAALAAARLGQALLDTDQPAEAATAFARAAESFRSVGDLANEAAALKEQGDALLRQEHYVAAHDAYRQAMAIARDARQPGLQAKSARGVGLSLYYLGEYAGAAEALREAARLAGSANERLTEVTSLMSLGNVYYFQGRTADAVKAFEDSLAAARSLQDPALEGRALGNLGLALTQARQHDRAAGLFEQAIANARARGDKRDEAQAQGNLGAMLIEQGRNGDAVPRLQRSRELASERGYERGEAIALRNLGFAQLRNGQAADAEASLRLAIAKQDALRGQAAAVDPFNISLLESQRDAYRTLQAALVAQQRTDAALEVSELARARSLADLMARRGGAATPTPSLETMRGLAKSRGVTIVEYSLVPAADAIYAWVITPDGEIHFQRSALKAVGGGIDAAIEGLVRDTRAALGAVGPTESPSPSAKADGARRDQMLAAFHQLLIAPLEKWLPASPDDLVVLVPQGALFLLPYAALRDAQGRALIDAHTIVVAPSIQTLARLPPRRSARRADALVAGNPLSADIRIGRTGTQVLRSPPLPGAEREAGAIAELLQTRPLIGREASRAAIVQRLPSADVVHLATHGTAEDVRGDGVPGALVLTASGRDDGLLTTSDLMALQLRADLVVLSACNTGLGSVHSEGVIGMSRAFLATGARSVVVSLWSVSDQPTTELMQEFYRSLEMAPNKAAALRRAMLSTRSRYPDPLFWSGFLLIGASD